MLEKSAVVFLLDISALDPHIFHEILDVLESHVIKTDTDSFHKLSLFREGFWRELEFFHLSNFLFITESFLLLCLE